MMGCGAMIGKANMHPRNNEVLRMHPLILADMGCATTSNAMARTTLAKQFLWSNIRDDVHLFMKSFIQCLPETRGRTVLRRYGSA